MAGDGVGRSDKDSQGTRAAEERGHVKYTVIRVEGGR